VAAIAIDSALFRTVDSLVYNLNVKMKISHLERRISGCIFEIFYNSFEKLY